MSFLILALFSNKPIIFNLIPLGSSKYSWTKYQVTFCGRIFWALCAFSLLSLRMGNADKGNGNSTGSGSQTNLGWELQFGHPLIVILDNLIQRIYVCCLRLRILNPGYIQPFCFNTYHWFHSELSASGLEPSSKGLAMAAQSTHSWRKSWRLSLCSLNVSCHHFILSVIALEKRMVTDLLSIFGSLIRFYTNI